MVHTAVAAVAVVAAATMLAFSAEVIAQETGLGDSFVGFMFGGIATTLPELSTTIAATRLRQFEMAFSDAFGTNLCSTGLIFLADALYRGGPILNEVGTFSLFGVLLGILLTAVYLAGFVARSQRSILRMLLRLPHGADPGRAGVCVPVFPEHALLKSLRQPEGYCSAADELSH